MGTQEIIDCLTEFATQWKAETVFSCSHPVLAGGVCVDCGYEKN